MKLSGAYCTFNTSRIHLAQFVSFLSILARNRWIKMKKKLFYLFLGTMRCQPSPQLNLKVLTGEEL